MMLVFAIAMPRQRKKSRALNNHDPAHAASNAATQTEIEKVLAKSWKATTAAAPPLTPAAARQIVTRHAAAGSSDGQQQQEQQQVPWQLGNYYTKKLSRNTDALGNIVQGPDTTLDLLSNDRKLQLAVQVVAQEAGVPQAQLLERVQALLNVLPDMDARLQAMKPADVMSGVCWQACLVQAGQAGAVRR
ncbi:hypothetical protein OEZ86_011321 [Tetradesmus obliquus]|nr:hypothetical protein OEZ86_011321 [Tetradesmus obliquus]